MNDVVDEVQPLPVKDRARQIQELCEDNPELEEQVWKLLDDLERDTKRFLVSDHPDHAPPGPLAAEVTRVFKPGDIVGEFELRRELGEGASGTVFEAWHERLDRTVALKIFNAIPSAIPRMLREAKIAGKLRHDGIATVYHHGVDSGCHWLSMELAEGGALSDEIRYQDSSDRERGRDYLLPGKGDKGFVPRRIELVRNVALALQAAHQAGVIHRDIKPSNIVLTLAGKPKIVDFGMARAEGGVKLTDTGALTGTAAYMSREQALGREVDPRTDIYSLGAVLYEVLTGHLPYPGSNRISVIDDIRTKPIPTLRQTDPSLPKDLEAVCAKAMAEDRAERYETARAFAEDLERCLNFETPQARPTTRLYHFQKWVRRNRKILIAVVAGLLVVSVLVAAANMRGRDAGQRRTQLAQVDRLERDTAAANAAGNIAALVPIQRQLQSLREQVEPEGEARRRIEAGLVHLDTIGQAEIVRADESVDAAYGSKPFAPVDVRGLLEALDSRRTASALLSENERGPLPAVDNEFPRLSLSTTQQGDRVRLFGADLLSGDYVPEPAYAFPTPVVNEPIAPGRYRILVERENVGFAELSRWLGEWGRDYDLGEVHIVPTEDVTESMVSLPGGSQPLVFPLTVVDERNGGLTQYVQAFPHLPFHIDPLEVSNQQYYEFLLSEPEGVHRPAAWRAQPDDPGWCSRPVAGVAWRDARAYAEWAGKRLPTELEWLAAMRGIEGRAFPWGSDPPLGGQLVVAVATIPSGRLPLDELYALYLEHTRPVDEAHIDRTPDGVLNLAGNVSEWTDSMALGVHDGRLYPLISHRRSKGWSWCSEIPLHLEEYVEEQITLPSGVPARGFRCAKSLHP